MVELGHHIPDSGMREQKKFCQWEAMTTCAEALVTAFFNLPGFGDGPMIVRIANEAPSVRTCLYLRDAFGDWTSL